MCSVYWATIAAGRVGWCLLSMAIGSAWPVLALDAAVMLGAGVAFAAYRPGSRALQLWAATVCLGLGCASALPCALTMPAECDVPLTPMILMALNLAGTIGEMVAPFVIGLALQAGVYRALGLSIVAMMAALLTATATAWATSRPRAPMGAVKES
jgi:hypothetical protein